MVDFGSIYPDEEDITLAFDRSLSIVMEELQNIKDILRRCLNSNTYISADQCAQILHCKVSEIPAALPYYRASRIGNAGILYKLSELNSFIEERRVPKKS